MLNIFVNLSADGSAAIAASSGFPSRKARERRVVGQVLDVRTKFTGISGEIYLTYKKTEAATFYRIMMTTTPEVTDSWKQVALTTRTKEMITGLDTAKFYYFQVVALGASGQGEPSDIARMIAA